MQSVIKTENLSVVYNLGKTSQATAVQDINIEIYQGEYIVFFGPSGCGKSTLLYSLSGMETPSSGSAWINQKEISLFNSKELAALRRFQIGMVFQQYNLIPTLSVLDNVLLPNILGGLDLEPAKKKAKELLERFKIGNLSDRYPRELSGGQQQRVAIARSLIYDPPIILADEPVGNLDSKSSAIVMSLLAELNERDGKTIILVTHDPLFLNYAHRVFHMKDGKIIRLVDNMDKKPIAPVEKKEVVTEIEELVKSYPSMPEVQIKAKALTQYLLTSFDEPEIRRLEDFIAKRISGQINENQFRELIDRPLSEGGVGLYKQTAQDFTQKIERVLAEATFLNAKLQPPKRPLEETDIKIMALARYLLDGSNVVLKKEEELQRLDHFIRMRLEKRINRRKFEKYLDLPFKSGGVGLNTKTAKEFGKKMELALIKY
jgi:putative ABC transport system ATP-binding protein